MEPFIKDISLFKKYVHTTTCYFEYGSGGSTYYVANLPNVQKVYSVENDIEWANKVENNVKNDKLTLFRIKMPIYKNRFGTPTNEATKEMFLDYISSFSKLTNEEQKQIDLIMIDGRFRVACCLHVLTIINDNQTIMFDDFLNRNYYHVVLKYCDIIEKGSTMIILRKKKTIDYTELQSDFVKYMTEYR